MRFDLTNLTVSQTALLAAIATLMGALVAGVFALTVAFVNAWATNRNARNTARRDFRLKLFAPFLFRLDGVVVSGLSVWNTHTYAEFGAWVVSFQQAVTDFAVIEKTTPVPSNNLEGWTLQFLQTCEDCLKQLYYFRDYHVSLSPAPTDKWLDGPRGQDTGHIIESRFKDLMVVAARLRTSVERYVFM